RPRPARRDDAAPDRRRRVRRAHGPDGTCRREGARPTPGSGIVKVLIAGAGSVGRAIARDLTEHGHAVLLMDNNPAAMRVSQVAEAEWMLADACELSALSEAGIDTMDVVVA